MLRLLESGGRMSRRWTVLLLGWSLLAPGTLRAAPAGKLDGPAGKLLSTREAVPLAGRWWW